LNFSDKFLEKILKNQFIKIRQVKGKLFHEDGQSGNHDDAVTFRNFANAPKKY